VNAFEIKDEEINVEEIMERIRENIRKRKQRGDYSEVQRLLQEPGFQPQVSGIESGGLMESLREANMAWQVQVRRPILSHRRFVRPLVIKIRKILQQEIRWTVDPIVDKQEHFNALIVRVLNALAESIESLRRDQEKDRQERLNINRSLNALAESIESLRRDQEKDDWNKLPMDLVSFQERYRGESQEIKRRLSIYVDFFRGCNRVLDVGCGRGEFLELLKENGIGAFGVDTNESIVQICLKKGLDVRQGDALSFLRSLEDGYLDGVFSAHLIEHLRPADLIEFIRLCSAKLRPGAYFIAETPNPLSLSTLANFYLDPSHVKPIHPETMRFLLESNGFEKVEFRFGQPSPEGPKLSLLDTDSIKNPSLIRLIEKLNQNLTKLNDLVLGFQDYAVIARKI